MKPERSSQWRRQLLLPLYFLLSKLIKPHCNIAPIEWAGIFQNQKNKTHNSRLFLASAKHRIPDSRRKTDKHLLAFLRAPDVRNKDNRSLKTSKIQSPFNSFSLNH
jgi:hypothetical protein